MIDPDGKMRYDAAVKWFLHLSNIRRTAVAFVFSATGLSLGFVRGKVLDPAEYETIFLLGAMNSLLALAGIFQEFHLNSYHRALAGYLLDAEEKNGPFTSSLPHKGRIVTHVTILGVQFILFLGWLLVIIIQICLRRSLNS